MSMSPQQLAQLFGGVTPVGGGVYMQQTGGPMAGAGSFAGEADVMMISGINGAAPVPTEGGVPVGAQTLSGQMQYPVTLGTITLPLWQWLLFALLAGGATGYYLGRR